MPQSTGLLAAILRTMVVGTASAETFKQEPLALRVGQTILVDDGSCPRGQIKQVTDIGGGTRHRTCVSRK
jgi:hypothetical protein